MYPDAMSTLTDGRRLAAWLKIVLFEARVSVRRSMAPHAIRIGIVLNGFNHLEAEEFEVRPVWGANRRCFELLTPDESGRSPASSRSHKYGRLAA